MKSSPELLAKPWSHMWRLWGAVVALTLAGCGGGSWPDGWSGRATTCAALSVGGPSGVAHIGALMALKDAGLAPDCVVGNSAGALFGSIYASAPDEPIDKRSRRFLQAYIDATRSDAGGGAFLGALFGLALGGPIGMAAGGALGAGSVDQMDHGRVVQVLDGFVDEASIDELPLPFATSYARVDGNGVEFVVADSGPLAQAVGGSIANPVIFRSQRGRLDQIDPGIDRLSRVPVELTCQKFPNARIIAINVTGERAVVTTEMNCPYIEITVDVGEFDSAEVMTMGPAFDRLLATGYLATCRTLGRSRCEERSRELGTYSTSRVVQ